MKTKKLQGAYENMINKELEPYGVTYTELIENKENQLIDGKQWFEHYTFKNEDEYNNWENYCVDYLIKDVGMSRKNAEREFSWFSLGYSLKIEND